MQEEKHVYSYHTFIFPFIWNADENPKKNYDKFVNCFEKNKKYWADENWKDSVTFPDDMKEYKNVFYKEYQYFHPYVRKSIYGYDGNIVRNFRFKPANEKKTEYIIKKGTEEYTLDIASIQLKIYNTGVALFIMQCKNTKKCADKCVNHNECNDREKCINDNCTLKAVKSINDYGRRIFAPFILKDHSSTADSLEIKIDGNECTKTDFTKFYENAEKDGNQIPMPGVAEKKDSEDTSCNLIRGILGYKNEDVKFVTTQGKKLGDGEIYIYPATDDRMFVLCAVNDSEQADEMRKMITVEEPLGDEACKRKCENLQKSLYELAYVDTDGSCTCQDAGMREKYVDKCLYRRWIGYDSIYTVTYQAVVMLSSAYVRDARKAAKDEKQDSNHNALDENGFKIYTDEMNYLYENFLTEYFQMLCLCLAQRASIIKFNQMVENYSSRVACEGNTATLKSELTDIQNRFLAFQGQLCFDEISSEEQAIELYGMMKERLFIDEELSVTKERVSALYEAANTSSGNELNESGNKLNIIATVFAFVSIVLSIVAMGFNLVSVSDVVYFEGDVAKKNCEAILYIVACAGITLLVVGLMILIDKIRRKK
jgi:Mg2+ and Co2+ transporter CorA